MQLYSGEGTAVVILIIGALILGVSGFSAGATLAVLVCSLVSFSYLIWYRKTRFEDPADSMIGFLPGHYLILFAFTLNGSDDPLVYGVWSLLILTTLGYDFTTNLSGGRVPVKLTSMVQYCIIWGVIVFLFQGLIIDGLELGSAGILSTRSGLSIGGIIWVGIGLYRIHRNSSIERRS